MQGLLTLFFAVLALVSFSSSYVSTTESTKHKKQKSSQKQQLFSDVEVELALMDLYSSTSGAGWNNKTGWESGDPCVNTWFGIGCDSGGDHCNFTVSAHTSFSTPLDTLRSSFASRTHLENKYSFSINSLRSLISNNLSGTIPASITNLAQLQSL